MAKPILKYCAARPRNRRRRCVPRWISLPQPGKSAACYGRISIRFASPAQTDRHRINRPRRHGHDLKQPTMKRKRTAAIFGLRRWIGCLPHLLSPSPQAERGDREANSHIDTPRTFMTTVTRYRIPAASVRVEQEVSRSRFIASLANAATVEAARDYIAAIRAEMPDASHHVY